MQKGELYYQLLKRRKKTATESKYIYKEEPTTINRNQVSAKNYVLVWCDHLFFLSPKGNSKVTRIIRTKNL